MSSNEISHNMGKLDFNKIVKKIYKIGENDQDITLEKFMEAIKIDLKNMKTI